MQEFHGRTLDALDTASARHDGLIPSGLLAELGVNSHVARALVAARELVRVRRGIYVRAGRWKSADESERYRLFIRASALTAGRPAVLSHLSAAALHGLPTIGGWPRAVHALHQGSSGGSTARFTTSHRGVADPNAVLIGGLAVTSLARTLIDVAAGTSLLVGVTMIDHALRARGALTKKDLYAELAAVNPRAGAGQAERAISFASPLAENPGESLSRVRIFQLGFEVPERQVCFSNVKGHDYWVDFYWRGVRKIGEFDGKLKYTRGQVLGGRDPGEVVYKEKRREEALRFLVGSFDRRDWDTALSPRLFHGFLTEHGVPRA